MALDVKQMGFVKNNKCQILRLFKGVLNLHSLSQGDVGKIRRKINLKI